MATEYMNEFSEGDRVRVKGIGNSLDGKLGTIAGKATNGLAATWIVRADDIEDLAAVNYPYSCFALPSCCLEREVS